MQKIVNFCPKFGTEVKMKIQITIARNGHFKSLYCLYVLPSVDKNHNYLSKIWDWSKVSTTKHLCKKLVILKKVLSAAICWKKSVENPSTDQREFQIFNSSTVTHWQLPMRGENFPYKKSNLQFWERPIKAALTTHPSQELSDQIS